MSNARIIILITISIILLAIVVFLVESTMMIGWNNMRNVIQTAFSIKRRHQVLKQLAKRFKEVIDQTLKQFDNCTMETLEQKYKINNVDDFREFYRSLIAADFSIDNLKHMLPRNVFWIPELVACCFSYNVKHDGKQTTNLTDAIMEHHRLNLKLIANPWHFVKIYNDLKKRP